MTRLRLAVAATALAAVAGSVPAALALRDDSGATRSVSVSESALLAYEKAILPLVQDGGRTVQQGMKPALEDLQYRHVVPPAHIAQEAEAWLRTLRRIRQQLAAVHAPDGLGPAHAAFLQALDEYAGAAETFRAAALAPAGAGRDGHIEEGIAQAQQADRTYDRGSAVLQSARRSAGLESSPYFPEVPRG